MTESSNTFLVIYPRRCMTVLANWVLLEGTLKQHGPVPNHFPGIYPSVYHVVEIW